MLTILILYDIIISIIRNMKRGVFYMSAKIKKTTASKLDWNVGTLIEMMDNKEIDFDASIQRGLVWDSLRNSKFIHTILIQWSSGIFYFNKVDNIFECIEGKQRSHAIYDFIRNGKKLHKNTPAIIDRNGDIIEVAKRKFEELPKELQNIIMRYGLLIECFDDMSIDDKVEFFTRINSGKPVTAADISRIKVKSRKIFQALSKHIALETGMTAKAKSKFANEDTIKNIWIMCYNENKSLLDKDTSPIFESTEVKGEQEEELNKILDYMYKFLKYAYKTKELFSKVRAKTHLCSLGYMAFLAIKNSMSEDEYCEKAVKFFNTKDRTPSISEEYNKSSASSSAKPEQVMIRISELEKALDLK